MLPDATFPVHPPRALYVGDVRASRGLWRMVEAIEGAPGWQLDIVGPVGAADSALLGDYLLRGPAGDRIVVHGRQPPRVAWAHARSATCGFVLLDDTPAFRDAMPSKLYEYAACGLPVIVTDLPRQRAFVRAQGIGEVVRVGEGAGPAAAAVLRQWALDPARLDAHREAAAVWGAQASDWRAQYRSAAEAVRALR